MWISKKKWTELERKIADFETEVQHRQKIKGRQEEIFEKRISQFMKKEKEEAEKALEQEKDHVCINPKSYIAKEIKYQTALLHEILQKIQN